MTTLSRSLAKLAAAFALLPLASACAQTERTATSKPATTYQGASRSDTGAPASSISLPNGVEVRRGGIVLRVTALRQDVLRVRMGRPTLGEDASWAVLPSARTSVVQVTAGGEPDSFGFNTSALRVRISRQTLAVTVTDLQGNVLQQDAADRPLEFHGSAFRIYKSMPVDEHYFGLGDKVGPLDRRNQAFTLWNTDSFGFQESTDPIYKSIPFFMAVRAGRTLGVFFDNTFRTSFDFGKETPSAYSFGSEDGPVDYYLMYGPDAKKVLGEYAWLTGTTPLPPLWSLGYQQSRYSYYPETRVREIADRLRADKIPADVIWLDIDFQKENRPFTVDEVKFPHFAKMVADLKQQGLHTVVITDLHVARLPGAGYAPYDSGEAGDQFVKNPDGAEYVGKVWPGPSVFPDFTRAATRTWWGTLFQEFTTEGVAGFWNDMNEPATFGVATKTMPDNVQHRIEEPGFAVRTASHLEMHNVYGMENSRATFEGLKTLQPNQRPFVMTRASYAGGQRYATTWTGDNSSTWNHLRMSTPMLLNLGLSGFAMAGADVGGFAGTPQADLLTRWLELAAFQPIDRDHTAKGTGDQEPWVHGPEQEAIRRRYIEERYRLMPYLYTTAEEMSRSGVPIIRPLFVEFPDAATDKHPIDVDGSNEFMFGPNLLVAASPFPDELDDYAVQLPPVDWFDYWTGERIARRPVQVGDPEQMKETKLAGLTTAAAKPVLIHPKLDTLPVYVREGSIVPMAPLTESTMERPAGPLTLRVYPPSRAGLPCSGSIYLDDGETLDYTRGVFVRESFTCAVGDQGTDIVLGRREGSYAPWWKTVRVELLGWNGGVATVTVDGKSVAASPAGPANSVVMEFADTGRGVSVHVAAARP